MTSDDVLALVAAHPHVMGTLDSGACAIQHVSRRNADGPDVRTDNCPCDRKARPATVLGDHNTGDEKLRELGGGFYVSSPTHTLGDLVRDVVGQE